MTGFRNFANKTFANYWRKSRGYTGESSVDIRQLAKVQPVYWRKFSGYSPIGESSVGIRQLAKVQWVFANWRKYRGYIGEYPGNGLVKVE